MTPNSLHSTHKSRPLAGSLAIAAGAGIWGLFWIPLRFLDENGIHDLWAVALLLGTPLIFILPYVLAKKQLAFNRWYILFGMTIGTSVSLYFAALILTDVIRVVFLFYLLPVWAIFLNWLIYGNSVKPIQMLAIALALSGLTLLLGGGSKFPFPQNLGDWFGIGSGFLWALSLVMIRANPNISPVKNAAAPFIFGAPIALVVGLVLHFLLNETAVAMPTSAALVTMSPVALLVGLLVLLPSLFGQVWGARFVSAPTAALVTMTEILLATLSAWLLIGTTLSASAWVGGGLIIIAAIIDLKYSQEHAPDE